MSDLETRLREIGGDLPGPDPAATEGARATMHAARGSASWARGSRWSRVTAPGSKPLLLAAALLVVAAGGALAAAGWSVRDLPPFGRGDEDAFVLPTTDILPGGYERTRPPRYSELPERPALLFPAGVGYTEALTSYSAARARGEILPPGAELDDPLPAGKVVMVRDDGRVAIDPAAPFGYAATTGLVRTLAGPFRGTPEPIARCQVLIGAGDPRSPACDAPGPRAYVREGVDGRWLPSGIDEDLLDPLLPAGTGLSVIDDPTTPAVRLPRTYDVLASQEGRRPRPVTGRVALDTEGLRLVVAPLPDERICFISLRPEGGGFACGPRSRFLARGAQLSGGRRGTGPLRIDGLVGDGITRVTTDDGQTARVTHNVFTLSPADAVRRLTFSGPVGTFSLPFDQYADEPRRFTPDRSRERELIGIDLRGGGRASVRVAPNVGGGRCDWVYVKGDVRSSSCSRPGDTPLGYDTVTGGFIRRIDRVSDLFEGRFAPQVGGVEIAYADGDTERLTPTGGYVLHQVPVTHTTPATRATTITTLDHRGVPLARAEVPYRRP